MQIDLSGRIALVTGASRAAGIGVAVVRALAAAGADVFITYFLPYDKAQTWGAQPDDVEQLLSDLRGVGVRGYALTTSLAAGVAKLGITVNAIDPGPTDTGWMSEELHRELSTNAPFGRVGLPTDVANLVCFLASDQGGWITGQVLHSRGGF